MKKFFLTFLIIFIYIAVNGCVRDSAEDIFSMDLRTNWLKLAKMPVAEAFEANHRLLTKALALESANDFKKLRPDGVIGNLALRQYLLCQILDRSMEAEYYRKLAFQRLVRSKIIPQAYTESQKEELFEKITRDLRTVEAGFWVQNRAEEMNHTSQPKHGEEVNRTGQP